MSASASASTPAPDPGPRPVTVGRYRLVHRLGEGGMGVVHLALDTSDRAVALKVLRPHVAADPLARQRLAREVSVLRRVRHPRVAEVLDADVAGDPPFVVTRFVPGQPLDDYVRQHGPLSAPHLAVTARTLADALGAIHASGVVHRDVKPANVMMLDGLPVLIDFGIAHIADESRITHTGLVMGTPGYLSPELADGAPVTAATDWWGWAATLAFAASGRAPFGTGPVAIVMARVQGGTPDLNGVESRLLGAFTAALTANPAMRPPPELLLAGLEGRPAVRPVQAPVHPGTGAGRPPVTEPVAPPQPVTERVAPPQAVTQRVAPPQPVTERMQHARTRAMPPERHPAPAVSAVPPAAARPSGPPPGSGPPPLSSPARGPAPAASWSAPRGPDAPTDPAQSDVDGLRVLVLVLVGFALMAAVAPPGAAFLAAVAMAVARTVDRCVVGLLRRRYDHGPRGSDTAVTVLSVPWAAVRATGATLFAVILPALVAISVAFMAGVITSEQSTPQPGSRLALVLGAVAGLLTAWWGPGGGSLRSGTRTIVRAATRDRVRRIVTYSLLGLVVASALLTIAGGNPPDWGELADVPALRQYIAANR